MRIDATAPGTKTVEFTWYKDSDGTAAADLQVDQHTQWVAWPDGATHAEIAWGHTGTDTPVGTKTIRLSEHGDLSVSKYAPYGMVIAPAAGVAGSIIAGDIKRNSAYLQLHYAATSGGLGAVHTDDTETASRPAKITFYRGAA